MGVGGSAEFAKKWISTRGSSNLGVYLREVPTEGLADDKGVVVG